MSMLHRFRYADVAELADAHGSGPCESNFMQVQLLSSAPEKTRTGYLVPVRVFNFGHTIRLLQNYVPGIFGITSNSTGFLLRCLWFFPLPFAHAPLLTCQGSFDTILDKRGSPLAVNLGSFKKKPSRCYAWRLFLFVYCRNYYQYCH